jgi:transposase
MLYAGLDYHLRTSSICILNEDGKVFKQQTVRGSGADVAMELSKLDEPFSVVFEASGGYGPLHARLTALPNAKRVVMAHPGALRLIWGTRRKTDRIDGQKLAKLLYLDAVPPAHVPSAAVRQWRRLIELRRSLIMRRTALKNQVHAMLRSNGIVMSMKSQALFSRRGIAWLNEQAMDETSAIERIVLVEQLRQIHEQLRTLERSLLKVRCADPRVTLLLTIPGVGVRTAETFVAYVDSIERFSRTDKVASYFGLVPCEDSSAGRQRLGHITKQGPSLMRQLLVRRKIAIVAMAHHLCRVMTAMLRSGQPWKEQT